MKGKLVVIEGLDGSGKSTQFERLIDFYTSKDVNIKGISFPNYEEESSALVKMYLSGDICKEAGEVNPYAASSFYAADRYISYKKYWEADYQSGAFILAARYTTSNIIHQMSKLPKSEWTAFIDWLKDYEYTKMGMPTPDLVIYLDMPTSVSQKLMSERYGGDESKKDIHEQNREYLKTCEISARFAAEADNWVVISCTDGERVRSIEEISNDIIVAVDKIL